MSRPTPLLLVSAALLVAGCAPERASAQDTGQAGAPSEPDARLAPRPPAITPSVRFVDVAARSAIRYTSNNDFEERKYFPQPMCGGVALIDYDGDGKLDIFFTNGSELPEYTRPDPSFYSALLRGRGDGTFSDVTEQARVQGADLDFSFGVATGDIDNDGDPDLFIASAGPNTLYRNEGDGTFSDVSEGSGLDGKPEDLLSVGGAFFDYDGDGLLDLVVTHYTYWSPALDRRCSSPQGEIYCAPPLYPSVPNSLYRNRGGGRFEDVSESSGLTVAAGKGMGIALADFDDDGWMDVFFPNDTEPNFLFMNQGDGKFTEESWTWGIAHDEQGSVVSGMGTDARDYDNDGWPDVFYNDLQNQLWGLFRNEQGELFSYASPASGVARLSQRFSGWSGAFVDYDNDGWKDIYSSNGDVDTFGENAEQHDTMFHNVDGKSFVDVSAGLGPDFVVSGYQRGSAVGDLNDDGFPDLVVTSLNRKPRILLNSGGNGNHWLWLDLVGRDSNRDAVGARVEVTTASGRVLHNHVSPSVGFMSSSDRRLHFGLGSDPAVRSIEIRWPKGKTQVLDEVEVDRFLRVEEPR